MCISCSYSSLPANRACQLAEIVGMRPAEIARIDEHPLRVDYLGAGKAVVYVTKIVLVDATKLQRLLSITELASPSEDVHVSLHQEKEAN